MNEYRLFEYDHDSSDDTTKELVSSYVLSYVSRNMSSSDNIFDKLMDEIISYKTKVFIAYDGGYPMGIIACYNRTFYYHQIIQFIYLEEKYRSTENYDFLWDLLIKTTRYSGLAIITQNPIAEEYQNTGFFEVDYKNAEKSLIYLRTLNKKDEDNKEAYVKKHVKYLKNFKLLYSSFFYAILLFMISLINVLLFVFNESVSLFVKVPLLLVTVLLFTCIFLSKYLLKKYNNKGENAFGFTYDIVYVNLFQYKFTNKTKEFFTNFIQALKDSGV